MRCIDRRAVKDARMKGPTLTPNFDDATRCVTGAKLSGVATSKNAVTALRRAVGRFDVPAIIPSDNSFCFVGFGRRKKPSGSWTPAPLEAGMLVFDTGLNSSRPRHPYTNCKPGRLRMDIGKGAWCYGRLDRYLEYCNTDRAALRAGHEQLQDTADCILQQDHHR